MYVPAAERTMRILERLARGGAATPSEVGRDLELPRVSVSRVLKTLTTLGYAWCDDETNRYALTAKLFSLASDIGSLQSARVARSHLARLRDETGETVEFAVCDGDELLMVDVLDGPASIRLFAQPGTRFPLYLLATGLALLAGEEATEIRTVFRRLPAKQRRRVPGGGLKGLLAELAGIRAQGYSLDRRRVREDVERVAAPVFGPDGRVVAAVGIAGPAYRLVPTPEVIGHVQSAAQAISADLGAMRLSYE